MHDNNTNNRQTNDRFMYYAKAFGIVYVTVLVICQLMYFNQFHNTGGWFAPLPAFQHRMVNMITLCLDLVFVLWIRSSISVAAMSLANESHGGDDQSQHSAVAGGATQDENNNGFSARKQRQKVMNLRIVLVCTILIWGLLFVIFCATEWEPFSIRPLSWTDQYWGKAVEFSSIFLLTSITFLFQPPSAVDTIGNQQYEEVELRTVDEEI